MSNKDWPCGMHPVRMLDGQAPFTTRWPLRQGIQTTKQATAIYKGSIVCWNNTVGHVRVGAVTSPGNVVGVAAEYYSGSALMGTKVDLAVWDGEKHIFAIQADNNTTTSSVKTLYQKNAAVLNGNAGSTITGLSTMELDFSSASASVSKVLRIIGATGEIGESGTGANLKLLVRFNSGFLFTQDTVIQE